MAFKNIQNETHFRNRRQNLIEIAAQFKTSPLSEAAKLLLELARLAREENALLTRDFGYGPRLVNILIPEIASRLKGETSNGELQSVPPSTLRKELELCRENAGWELRETFSSPESDFPSYADILSQHSVLLNPVWIALERIQTTNPSLVTA